MNCAELQASTGAYVEKQLDAELRAAFERHLVECASCQRWFQTATEMTCRQLADFVSDYLEKALPEEQREVFERHLDMCPPCVDYMHSLRATIEAGRKACEGENQVQMPEALVKAILQAKQAGH